MKNLLLVWLLTFSALSHAANSLMIWPIDPAINPDDKASELWLENRGDATTLMQVRIFTWQQVNQRESIRHRPMWSPAHRWYASSRGKNSWCV